MRITFLLQYHQLLDQAETGKVLAVGIQEAYEDLFALRKDAQQLSLDEVKGKLKTLTQGQKSDNIINLMANTFKALCELADCSVLTGTSPQETYTTPATSSTDDLYVSQEKTGQEISKPSKMNLHYNIQIHLPETTNMAVYDAIFQSLKKHLM